MSPYTEKFFVKNKPQKINFPHNRATFNPIRCVERKVFNLVKSLTMKMSLNQFIYVKQYLLFLRSLRCSTKFKGIPAFLRRFLIHFPIKFLTGNTKFILFKFIVLKSMLSSIHSFSIFLKNQLWKTFHRSNLFFVSFKNQRRKTFPRYNPKEGKIN